MTDTDNNQPIEQPVGQYRTLPKLLIAQQANKPANG
jgi:hypothetical protein